MCLNCGGGIQTLYTGPTPQPTQYRYLELLVSTAVITVLRNKYRYPWCGKQENHIKAVHDVMVILQTWSWSMNDLSIPLSHH